MELNFNILKEFITHLYKHIGETIVWYLCLLPSLSPILLDSMKQWKHGCPGWLPPWINENLTSVQYLFLCIFDMLPQTPYANCIWG